MARSVKSLLIYKYTLSEAQKEISKKNYAEAERLCQKIVTLKLNQVNDYEVYLMLAIINYHYRKYDLSEYYANYVITCNPRVAEAHNIIGNIFTKRNKNERAIVNYINAVNLSCKSIDFRLNLAEAFIKADLLEDAVKQYKECLILNPGLYAVQNNLGNTYRKQGCMEDAKACYRKCIDLKPDYALAWNNLGCLYNPDTEFAKSFDYFIKATILDPSMAIAYYNCGNVLNQIQMYEEGKYYYDLGLKFLHSFHYFNKDIANAFFEQEDYENCILEYKKAFRLFFGDPYSHYLVATSNIENSVHTAINKMIVKSLKTTPHHINSFMKLGNLKQAKKCWNEAKRLYQSALDFCPTNLTALCHIADICKLQGNLAEAMDFLQRAILIDKNHFLTHFTLGTVLMEGKFFSKALLSFKKALEIDPTSATVHLYIGKACKVLGRVNEALHYFNTYLSLEPDSCEGLYILTHTYLTICYWIGNSLRMKKIKDFTSHQLANNIFPSIQPHHAMLFPLAKHQHKAIAKAMADSYVAKNKYLAKTSYVFYPRNGRRLKIGYVSSDFGNHCTSHLMQSVPGCHNREKYEIYCYALNPDDKTAFREKLTQESEHFKDVSGIICNGKVADLIFEDGIDILVNMNLYTKGGRNEIFALRPAPIQVAWLGYPGTSGSSFIDYLITDKIASPIEMEDLYSEKLAHMKHTFFIGDHKQMFPHLQKRVIIDDGTHCCDSIPDNVAILNGPDLIQKTTVDNITSIKMPEVLLFPEIGKKRKRSDRSEEVSERKFKVASGEVVRNTISLTCRQQYGIPDDAMVYCNFNQMYKVDMTVLGIWMTVLLNVPNSVLWLLKFPPEAEINIRTVAVSAGLDTDRLIFTYVAPKEEHVRRGQLADVCLDTLVCNGHTTNMDLLWTGTPVVTMLGENIYNRIAASQLTALGCPELIAKDQQEYLRIAFKLGTDKDMLRTTREKVWLLRSKSVLFDVRRFTFDLEALYSEMWERFEAGVPLQHIQTHEYCDFD